MPSYFFVPRVLALIADGRTFRVGIALTLQRAAVGLGLAALVSWIGLWSLARFLEPSAIVGLVAFQLLFIVAAYAILHTIVIRAAEIRARDDGEFVILPIIAACCRLVGECLAWFFCALGVGGALLTMLAGQAAYLATSRMPFGGMLSSGAGLIGGALNLVLGVMAGFVALLFFYLISESSSLLTAIARNTEQLRKVAEQPLSPLG